eukprot:16441871-Heterocapsa_arctica.AAC.1
MPLTSTGLTQRNGSHSNPESWFQNVLGQLLRPPSPEEMGVKEGTCDNSSDPDISLHAVAWKRDLEMRTMFDSTPLRDAWIRGRSAFLMAWMLTCTMLRASYNIHRDNLCNNAPDIKEFQIQCPGRKQLTKVG